MPLTGDETEAASSSDAQRAISVRGNFCWMLAGNVIYAGCQWGILVALAKLGNPEMVGVFGLALAVTAPIMMFFNLELRSVQVTDTKRVYALGHYLGLRLITSFFALSAIVLTAFICCKPLITVLVVITLGVAKTFESLSDVIYGFFQNRERMDRVAVSMIIKGFVGLAALSIAIYFTKSCLWGVAALAAAWLVPLVFYDMTSAQRLLKEEAMLGYSSGALRPRWDVPELRRLARLSLPLGCAMMLVSLNVTIPRYFVQGYFGERQLGFFVAVSYLMVVVNTVVSALGQAACPRLACYYSGGGNLRAFRRLLTKLVILISVLSGVGILAAAIAGPRILTIIYRREYASGADVFVWLMVAAGIGGIGVVLRYANIATRRFGWLLPLWVVVVASNALVCLLLIPRYGLKGAGIAMTVAALIQLIGNLLILLRSHIAPAQANADGRCL